HQLLQRDRHQEALQSLRFAACLEDTSEAIALEYFEACRSRGRTPEALLLLQQRVERSAQKAGGPAQTLFHALAALHREAEAFALLDRVLALRPDDGELLLFAAEEHAGRGRLETAARLLATAAGRASEAARLTTSARLAARTGDLAHARECWQQILAHDPLD